MLAALTPLSRNVVIWILKTWCRDLQEANHHMFGSVLTDGLYVYSCPDQWREYALEIMFCNDGSVREAQNLDLVQLPYDDLTWARINNSSGPKLRPRMLNAIAWFPEVYGVFTGPTPSKFLIGLERASVFMRLPIMLAPRRRVRLYDDLCRSILISELTAICADCRKMIYALVVQLAWDSRY